MPSWRKEPQVRILCVADHVDPLVYSVNARERFKDIQLVIGAGDLNMSYLGFIASTLNVPVAFVFGNHNLKHMERFKKSHTFLREGMSNDYHTVNFFGSTYLGDKVKRIKGLLIAGLGGSIRYNHGQNQYTDFQMNLKCIRMIPRLLWNKIIYGRYLDIFLTHSPPRHLGDREDNCHRGFTAFRWFLRMFKPRYMLHGHIHLYDHNAVREQRYDETQIINVYDHYVLEFPGEGDSAMINTEAVDE